MRVLVVTVVHNPEDARILHREIAALCDRGHRVRYAAPFQAVGVLPRSAVEGIDLPRAVGRNRWRAFAEARRLLADQGADADLVLLHDPELLLTLPGLARGWRRRGHEPLVVWDVHEDTPASIAMKHYVPRLLRRPLEVSVRSVERVAERRLPLLLAENAYQQRFRHTHPVVPNLVPVPREVTLPGGDRVVYLGHLSRARGALDLIDVAGRLPAGLRMELIGSADSDVRGALAGAHREGLIRWHGFVPNDRALGMLRGALAGLALLHDEANYRHSRPTKIVEYMAQGIPVVTTPNPLAVELVQRYDCGIVVPFEDPDVTAAALSRLRAEPALRVALGCRGHAAALADLNWRDRADAFVDQLEAWVPPRLDNEAQRTPAASRLRRTLVSDDAERLEVGAP